MRKIYTLFAFLLLVSVANAQFPAPYCAEDYSVGVEPITSVVFNTINNTSPAAINTTTPHEDYTTISTSIVQGNTYVITIKGNTDGSFSDYCRVFIDWDQNGDFTGSDESYDIGIIKNSTGVDAKSIFANIVVPASATLGTTRMRVTKKFNAYQSPCNTGGFGESEDYTVNVIVATNCTGTPPVATASAPASFCQDSLITVSISGLTATGGLTYQWQSTTIGGTVWTDVAGAVDAASTFTHVAGGVDYRCKVTCTVSTQTTNSTKITVASVYCGPPLNDECDSAFTILYGIPMNGTTIQATQTMPATACSSFTGTADDDVWYKFTASQNGTSILQLTTTASFDAVIVGYSGVCGSLTEIACADASGSGSSETLTLPALTSGDTYYFRVYSYGSSIANQNTFTLNLIAAPTPPDSCATNITPADNAIDVPVGVVIFKWSKIASATSYDLYGGTTNPPTTFVGNFTADSASINLTGYSTTFYWYVVPKNLGGSATGCDGTNTTSFTTVAPPPIPATCATNIAPADNAVDVPAGFITCKWTPVALATSYDLYRGTTNPPTTLMGNYTLDSALISFPAYSTVYYWYVVPKNGGGTAIGCDATNTTTFTTAAAPPPPVNDDCDSAINLIAGIPLSGSTISATQTIAATSCSGFNGTADDDVWYMFTATASGDANITLTPVGTSFDAVIIAYSGTCGNFTIIGCADTSFSGGTEIVHLTGLNASETYYFRVYSYGSTATSPGSFSLSLAGSALLPVTITKFIGERKNNVNILSWATATEQNNKGFEIQRSSTGDYYLPMNFIESKANNGNSSSILNYQFIDNKPFAATTYYRLKQVDKNGKTTFSNIVAIKGDRLTTLSITDVYPNPATQILNLVIASPIEEKINIIVTDITGKVVETKNVQIASGNNNTKLDISNLSSGSYLLKILCNTGCNSATVKFVKQ